MNIETIHFIYGKSNKIYSVLKDFDKGLSTKRKSLILLILRIVSWLRLDNLFFFLLKLILYNVRTKNKKGAFVFTKNQNIIFDKINKNEKDTTLYSFNFKRNDKCEVFVSDLKVLLGVLANPYAYKVFKDAVEFERYSNDSLRLLKSIGLYVVYKELLKGKEKIILFNDHSIYEVLLYVVCQEQKIKTIYVQHAPVSNLFPKLFNDVNVLFSQDSADKYGKEKGVEIKLACDFRFLNVREIKEAKNTNSILLCPNELDSFEQVKLLINKLLPEFSIILRPHPLDERNWKSILGVKVSDSKHNSIWNDIENCYAVLTNESAVVLEAMFANRYVYKASFWSKNIDNYGFLDKGLITCNHNSVDTIYRSVKNKNVEFNKDKLAYFIGDVNNAEKLLINIFG